MLAPRRTLNCDFVLTTTKTTTFEQQLQRLGMITYDEYLASSFWMDARLRWQAAGMPEEFLIFGRHEYNLHHRTYARLGSERVADLVALCQPHHFEVHRLLDKGLPGVTLLDAHLHYRKQHFERRSRQPRLIGEIVSDEFEAILGQ